MLKLLYKMHKQVRNGTSARCTRRYKTDTLEKETFIMEKLTRRDFLRTSALTGAAAALAGAMPLAASAAAPEDENCLSAIKALRNTEPTMPSVVKLARGYVMGYCDQGIHTFRGIPYGNHERFKYATPASYGTAERPTGALTNASVSPQSNTQTEYSNWAATAAFMTPSESDMFSTESQCLNLNVWTSSMDPSAKKPVLVFMHGGGLQNGSALELKIYDGKYFADYTDCVFVSVNARLNYVGYLDLTCIGGDANIGVADMILSLQWVRDNIAQFGGDASNVTILGQSGGGTKVTALASAPAAQGLFNKVVYVSGGTATGRTPEAAATNAQNMVDYVRANVAGMSAASDAEIFAYLQKAHYDTLVDLCSAARANYTLTTGSPYFSGNFFDANGVLNDVAAQYTYMFGAAWAEMGGNNSADAVLYSMPGEAKGNISDAECVARLQKKFGAKYDRAVEVFKKTYPTHDLYDLNSLASFAGSSVAARTAARAPKVYEYLVTYTMPYFGGMTMIHTADLGFWFHSMDNVKYQIAGDEANAYKLQDTMASALAAFCTNGDPSTKKLAWEPYTAAKPRTMILDNKCECKDSSFDDELYQLIRG